ncbi:hypothetical protein K505DRAFT_391761 [Melanomma pulvis-pyrius CBS 109.77]|uniref:Uncharacterized protein n=1 Tax=Melanomma pulvis-pyrius CBS 109.77 TaxID=1314802 RepID=A0A6A6X128_9PLEO|nr:hypothetical protein K505DRAFT_391761 [Melanomma pulvis-pyrius CBS 109.77]
MPKETDRKMAADLKAALEERDSACQKYEFALEKLLEQRKEVWALQDELDTSENCRLELLNTVIDLLMTKLDTQDLGDLAHDVDETVALGIFKNMGSTDELEDNKDTLNAREILIQTVAKQEQRLIKERHSKVKTGPNNNEQASAKDAKEANYKGYGSEEPDGNLALLAKPPNKQKVPTSVAVAKNRTHQSICQEELSNAHVFAKKEIHQTTRHEKPSASVAVDKKGTHQLTRKEKKNKRRAMGRVLKAIRREESSNAHVVIKKEPL